MTVETRYMRSDQQTVNGLTAYILGTSQSAVLKELTIDTSTTIYVGIRVWVRHVDGSETEVLGLAGQASAIVPYSAGTAQTITLNAGFEVASDVNLVSTDAIRVDVYADISNPPTALLCSFVTEQLGANILNSASWTVYYRLRRTKSVGGMSTFYYRFGVAGDDSYITNFTWTPAPSPPAGVLRQTGEGLTQTITFG